MSQLIVYRSKTKHAWGESNWDFNYFVSNGDDDTKEIIEDIVNSIDEDRGYSDKYRGAVVEIVKNPPLDKLEFFAKLEKDKIKCATETLKLLETEIQKLGDD